METNRQGGVASLAGAPRRPEWNGHLSLEGRWPMRGIDGRASSERFGAVSTVHPSTGHSSIPLMHSSESAVNANPNEPMMAADSAVGP